MRTKLRFIERKSKVTNNIVTVDYVCGIRASIINTLNNRDAIKIIDKYGLKVKNIYRDKKVHNTYVKTIVELYFVFNVHGKAECHPKDIFDETKGFRLAESRAKVKAYNKMCRICSDIGDILFKHHNTIRTIFNKNYDCVCQENKHTIKLID